MVSFIKHFQIKTKRDKMVYKDAYADVKFNLSIDELTLH